MTKKKHTCQGCTGQCCRYIALPIETPEDKADFDDIRWYLCHKDVTVFVEDGDWYINIRNQCRHLAPKEHRCRIYDGRPGICRKYSRVDCDRTDGEYDYELHFTDDRQMQEYIKIRFDNNVKEKQRLKRDPQSKRKGQRP